MLCNSMENEAELVNLWSKMIKRFTHNMCTSLYVKFTSPNPTINYKHMNLYLMVCIVKCLKRQCADVLNAL
jgi:hypothetical protein